MSIPIMFALKDVIIKEAAPKELLLAKHIDFLKNYEKLNEYEYAMTEYLRMSGIYWCLTALDVGHSKDVLNRADVIEFVKSTLHANGGYGAAPNHDPHILHTLSAIQILHILDAADEMSPDRTAGYIASLQQSDGSFAGDEWGEIDSRFSFCAIATLALLDRLSLIDTKSAIDFVLKCRNFDGGFGTRPDSESHSGQIYCCVGSLAIMGQVGRIDKNKLGHWLAERQCNSGGLNGRPEKLPDVCYSWWVLASLALLGRLEWIDKDYLIRFIYACQDTETGGFSDRPEDMPDPFHTLFGLAGLSLLGEDRLKDVNPIFCMPQAVVDRITWQIPS